MSANRYQRLTICSQNEAASWMKYALYQAMEILLCQTSKAVLYRVIECTYRNSSARCVLRRAVHTKTHTPPQFVGQIGLSEGEPHFWIISEEVRPHIPQPNSNSHDPQHQQSLHDNGRVGCPLRPQRLPTAQFIRHPCARRTCKAATLLINNFDC